MGRLTRKQQAQLGIRRALSRPLSQPPVVHYRVHEPLQRYWLTDKRAADVGISIMAVVLAAIVIASL